jgi:hypothetical protein
MLSLAVLLALAACGGDSGEGATDTGGDQPDPTQAVTTQPASDDGGSDETTPPTGDRGDDATDSSNSDGSGPSTATVTLGDQTYNFSTEGAVVAQCLTDLFGTFSIQLPMIDDSGAPSDGSVAILALHEGTDPEEVGQVNAVEVSVGDEDWVADEADMMFEQSELLEPGMSQVDSVEIDGRTVRGTATFFRQNSLFTDQVETATGTFEATCGEERIS